MSNILPLLIEPSDLLAQLENPELLIVDLSRESVYQQAHVPNAIFLDFRKLLSGAQPATGKLPDAEKLTHLFSSIGLSENRHVVVYDDEGGGWAGRFIWTLDCIGHKYYSYLNGGIHAWIAEQMPIQQEAVEVIPSNYQVHLNDATNARVDKQFILDQLDTGNISIWDARSPEEFEGLKVFAARGGHIPGAHNYEWTAAMDKENSLRLRELSAVEKELQDAGIDSSRTVLTHCQTHHRSGFTYLLGKILGFKDIRAYDGSWSEWGNDPNTPIEQ